MSKGGKSIGAGWGIVLLVSLTTSAWGFVPGGGVPAAGLPGAGEFRAPLRIVGRVVCAYCDLHEARAAHPELTNLYELRHRQGQVVMQVAASDETTPWATDEATRWETIVGLDHRVPVRAADRLFQQLTAEENLLREVHIAGLLRPSRTYDMSAIAFTGSPPDPLAAGQSAQAAATRAETAAEQVEQTVQRIEEVAARAASQFTESLIKG